MFDFIDNTLCIKAESLYSENELGLMSYSNYDRRLRYKVEFAKHGGNGRKAQIKYESIPDELKARIKKLCDGKSPYELARQNKLKELIENDENAWRFFEEFRKPNGDTLSMEKRREYTANANVLNAITHFLKNKRAWRKTMGARKVNMWDEISSMVNELRGEEIPHSLPQTVRSLRNRHKRYEDGDGYYAAMHKGTGNSNPEKLSEIQKSWVFAKWATNVEKLTLKQLWEAYNKEAEIQDWKQLKDEKTIRNYLYQPEVKEQWYGHRYGELKAKMKYAYQQKTKLPSMRDSLWYSDGTKVNFYYLEDGKVQTTSVYEVMDVYSEVLLGYHISKSEDFTAQFSAFKMAVQFAGHKPYEARYDNQGGHKKLQNGDFLTKLSHLSIRTQPYNAPSKTIEAAFGRFQQNYLHKKWYFTGQNITAKKEESKANMEFILANKANLPSLEEVMAEYVALREEWNNAPHPATGRPRIEMYQESQNPKSPSISFLEMVDLFWVLREKPVTYKAHGLTIEHKGRKYTYTRYHEPLKPDVKWHRENVDRKFYVKVDPEDMTSVCVFKKTHAGLQFVAQLDEKVEVHRGIQEQESWESTFFKYVDGENKAARVETRDNTEKILEEHGLTAEQHGLVSPPLKGLESLKSRKEKSPKRKKIAPGEIGKAEKELSNVVPDVDDADFDNYFYNKL